MLGIQWVAMTKIVKTLDTNLHGSLQSMICQQVTLSGDAEWPKVADAVIEADPPVLSGRVLRRGVQERPELPF